MATRKQILDNENNEILPITDTDAVRNPQNIGGTLESRLQNIEEDIENNDLLVEQSSLTDQQRNIALANVSNQTANSITGKMGYVVLQPEKAGDATTTFAAQIANKPNTIFEIRDVFDLNGGSVTIPANCTLKFEGGKVNNGSVVGNNTSIIAPPVEILNTSLSGTWNCSSYCEWVGGNLKKAVETFGGVSLLENKTYNVSETITFPFGASISGFSSSIVKSAASDIGIMFNLGYHNTLNGFTVIVQHDCTVVNIQTDNISRTYRQRNDRGTAAPGNCNIIIDGVRFRSNDIEFTHNCIELISDGYSTSQTTLTGFWGVQIVNCLIAGYWKNAIHIDCGSNVNNASIDSWLTSCFFRNIVASNLKDGFLLAERNDKGYVGTFNLSSIIFDSCELQYGSSMQYFAKCDHSEIIFNYCIPMDFTNTTHYIVNQDNSYLRINIGYFNGEYEHYVSRIGESENSSGFEINEGNVIGAMPSYFLNDLETTDIAKVSNFWRLPVGSFSSQLDAANYKQLKLDNLVSYGPSVGRTKYVLKKERGYSYTRYTITIYSSFGVGIYYLLILDSSTSTSNIPDWNVIPGLLQLNDSSGLTTQHNGLGNIYYINGKYASRPANWLTKDALGHSFTDNQFVNDSTSFPTFSQPTTSYNGGKMLLDKASKEVAVYDNTTQKWYEGGVVAGTPKSGATTNRPSGDKIYIGFMYFDTTLSKPVYASAIANADPYTVTWVDSTGTVV